MSAASELTRNGWIERRANESVLGESDEGEEGHEKEETVAECVVVRLFILLGGRLVQPLNSTAPEGIPRRDETPGIYVVDTAQK